MRKGVILLAVSLVVLTSVATANTAPLIHDLERNIVACESTPFSIPFEVAEPDDDILSIGISPSGPFYVRPVSTEPPITKVELFSDNLTKLLANSIYEHTVYVSDGEFVDTKEIKIKVLESNNPPKIDHLSVETIDLTTTETFQKKIKVADKESGTPEESEFEFSVLDSLDLLEMEIDSQGLITYTPSESHIGVHEVEVCATDDGVEVGGKLGVCAQEELRSTTCGSFQLAIVEENTPPTILLFNATNTSSRIPSTQKITFEVYKYDPEGIEPDTYWYVDNQLKEIDIGGKANEFTYSFGCERWGKHKVKVVISDGVYNDSIEWTFNVFSVTCLDGTVPRESIGSNVCEEKWGCLQWGLCQNALQSHEAGNLDITEYENLQQRCATRELNASTCGYQTRSCVDLADCNSVSKKPVEVIPCHFSLNPDCSDGIQNCHDGSCEFLTDCGGPCAPCPTCSDGIKNQDEEEVDCGGPCARKCTIQKEETPPQGQISFAKLSMLLAILVALLIAVVQIFRIMRNKKYLEEKSKKEFEVKYE